MTTFDEREQAYENKFAHDANLNFRAEVRCNKMLGLWAAELLGKTGNAAEAYASDIIKSDLDEASHDEVIASIASDLEGKASVEDVAAKRAEFLIVARKQVLEES